MNRGPGTAFPRVGAERLNHALYFLHLDNAGVSSPEPDAAIAHSISSTSRLLTPWTLALRTTARLSI